MPKQIVALALSGTLALGACETLTPQEQILAGGLAGAAAGLLTAGALNANTNWTILAALGGAAIGTLVARNRVTGQCAYARGDGTYYTAPCP